MRNNICKQEGCKRARYTYAGGSRRNSYCQIHKNEYQRNYFAQRPGLKAKYNTKYNAALEGHIYLNSSTGYYAILGFNHPAANPSGITPLHRIILWDKLNGKNVPCAECGGELVWFSKNLSNTLCVDHVDGDKTNNHPSNLEPVHNACNLARYRRSQEKDGESNE